MAIAYARMEFVKRSEGKTACAKSAYNSRSEVEFEGNCVLDPKRYSWDGKELPAHHEVMLPDNADPSFQNPKVLWNVAEAKERRLDAQVAMELVVALPDDQIVTLDHKINLVRAFVKEHFIDQGLGAQIDIHAPEDKIEFTADSKELGIWKGMYGTVLDVEGDVYRVAIEKGGKQLSVISFNATEFTGFRKKDHNWHAHVLITTRRFKEDGKGFQDTKARDLMPKILKGKIVEGPHYGKLWAQCQNLYFEQMGWSLRVDPEGIVPQEHLGPVRMRARAVELLSEHERRSDLNHEASLDASQVLSKLTQNQGLFRRGDVDRFLEKHVAPEKVDEVRESFWKLDEVKELFSKDKRGVSRATGQYTSRAVLEEERQIARLGDKLHSLPAHALKRSDKLIQKHGMHLNPEQKRAFERILGGERLICVQGYAGTGKSTMLKAVHDAYQGGGYTVRAFGPDTSTAQVLKEKGFGVTENAYRFLFAVRHHKRRIQQGKEVWIVDEAGKLGNKPLSELLKLAKRRGAQVILSGDAAQLPSVERGGCFKVFTERYGAETLLNIQRQSTVEQRVISKELAVGELRQAIQELRQHKCLHWSSDRFTAMEELIARWSADRVAFPKEGQCIIAHTNEDIRVLNELARSVRLDRGEISPEEFRCRTSRGQIYVSEGDLIEFRENNRELGVTNGLCGTLIEAKPDRFTVAIEKGQKHTQCISFDPRSYNAYQLGYASTYHRSQGKTVDRAYVLHSPMATREMFYVGLTRHVKRVHCFLSREETPTVIDLEHQVMRSSTKETTLSYTTYEEIERDRGVSEREERIAMLKRSDSFFDRMRGHGSGLWSRIAHKLDSVATSIEDALPNKEFYAPEIEEKPQELSPVERADDRASEGLQKSSTGALGAKASPMAQSATDQSFTKQPQVPLTKGVQMLLQRHDEAADRSAVLLQAAQAQAESEGKEVKQVGLFKELSEAAAERNARAYEVKQALGRAGVEELGSRGGALLVQSAKHEKILEHQKQHSPKAIEQRLKENISELVDQLFNEKPFHRGQSEVRFGSKGSLTVTLSGKNQGLFYAFEAGEGGGPLQLIERQGGLSKSEAFSWAKDFLNLEGGVQPILPSTHAQPISQLAPQPEWISLKPSQEHPAPELNQIPGKKLHYAFNEVSRHAYCDEKGDLLYYVLRLQSKKDNSQKITPPLSYGYPMGESASACWNLKGFNQGEKRSLYHVELLAKHSTAKVLIVEGEKAADKAASRFPEENFIALTWSGGAGAVAKSDWSTLVGREVVIWPDNDPAGFKAADDVCRELRRVGVSSLDVVDRKLLVQKFPAKWDLADPIPSTMKSEASLMPFIGMMEQQMVSAEKVLYRLHAMGIKGLDGNLISPDLVESQFFMKEVLWRLDERLRESSDSKGCVSVEEVNQLVADEAYKAFIKAGEISADLGKNAGGIRQDAEVIAQGALLAGVRSGKDLGDFNIAGEAVACEELFSKVQVREYPSGKHAKAEVLEKIFLKGSKSVLNMPELKSLEEDLQVREKQINQQLDRMASLQVEKELQHVQQLEQGKGLEK